MSRVFAVVRLRGPQWRHGRPLEEQHDWRPHADFMNALHAEGFALLGGPLLDDPLEDSGDTLLIARAKDAEEIRARLSEDVWERKGVLAAPRVTLWDLRLGSLG